MDIVLNQGPFLYESWKRHLAGEQVIRAYECPLYTDSHITGDCREGLGAIELMNGLAFEERELLRPGVILRANEYDQKQGLIEDWTTNSSRYHAGNLADEVAALISLFFGIRIKAGEPNRWFESGGDPRGTPHMLWGSSNLMPHGPFSARRHILPYARKTVLLSQFSISSKLHGMRPDQAMALIVAARGYQNAVWIAEDEPELSWLYLVSAIETVANLWAADNENNLDRLKSSKPDLYKLLAVKEGDLASKVADMIAPYLGATNKFIKFIIAHMPEPPPTRPQEHAQIKFSRTSLRKALSTIYDHRSEALHNGRPMPRPMCLPPPSR